MKIVADTNIPYVEEAFGPLGEVTLVAGRSLTPAAVRDAELLLVRSVTPVNAALLAGSRVRWVATATIGFDHLDTEYLDRAGIRWATAAGSNANSVAEYIVAALLELGRRHRFRLRDQTLGVVGVGNVGSRVVRYATALGMRVLPNDPPRERAERDGRAGPSRTRDSCRSGSALPWASLEQVLAEADILTFHVPLAQQGPDATHHLVSAERLAALSRRPVILNTARGGVVDNPALLAALRDGRVKAAVLDVWEGEPQLLPGLLAGVDLGTPHIAGYSFDGKVNGTRLIYEAACRHLGVAPTWQPALPPPLVPRVELAACAGEDAEETLRRVIAQVYDITADDAALRTRGTEPAGFDHLRAEYPVRREFPNTTVAVTGRAGASLRGKLTALGFTVRG